MSEEQQEKTVPTKDEIIAFIKEQIEVKSVQLELQELNTGLAVSRAEELKALAFIAFKVESTSLLLVNKIRLLSV